MVTPYQTEHVRAANRHSVYRALADLGTATRTALAERTGLSAPTLGAIVQELSDAGLVGDAGTEAATGGRPARRVRFLADAAHVLAVDLSGRHAHACRVALDGGVRGRHSGPALAPGMTQTLVAWLGERRRDDGPPLRSLALAVPGVVDPTSGHVDVAPALGWHALPLAARLQRELDIPVVLENDVNALALAELHYGRGADQRHVLYVAIGSGLGAGVVIGGRLHRGAHAAAGEIGSSLSCGDDADTLRLGAPGPLEARVVAAAEATLGPDGLHAPTSAARRRAFATLVDLLAPTLHNLACLLDPELVVVSWPADPGGRLVKALRDRWRGHWPVEIVAGSLGRDGAARGAALLALERIQDDVCRPRHGPAGSERTHDLTLQTFATPTRSRHA